MSSIKLHPSQKEDISATNPLPQLLHTPSGLAILELQGTINHPRGDDGEILSGFNFGRIEFPLYSPDVIGSAWMSRVHMYIGQHQRLTGEVKKLPKALAVVRRKDQSNPGEEYTGGDLEVVEIVKYKLMFSGRPEPVGTLHAPA